MDREALFCFYRTNWFKKQMWLLKYQAEADFMLAKAAFTHEWLPLQMNQKYNG